MFDVQIFNLLSSLAEKQRNVRYKQLFHVNTGLVFYERTSDKGYEIVDTYSYRIDQDFFVPLDHPIMQKSLKLRKRGQNGKKTQIGSVVFMITIVKTNGKTTSTHVTMESSQEYGCTHENIFVFPKLVLSRYLASDMDNYISDALEMCHSIFVASLTSREFMPDEEDAEEDEEDVFEDDDEEELRRQKRRRRLPSREKAELYRRERGVDDEDVE